MNVHSGSNESQPQEDVAKPPYRSRLRNLGAPVVMLAVTAVIAAFPEGTSRPGAGNPMVKALVGSITRQSYASGRLYAESCSLRRSAPNVSEAEIKGLRQDKLSPAVVLKAHDRIADPQTTEALDEAAKIEVLPIHGGVRAPIPSEFADGYDATLAASYRRAIGRHIVTANDDYEKLRILAEGSDIPLSGTNLFGLGLPESGFHLNADFQHMTTDISFAAGCQDEYQAEESILSK